MLDINSYSLGTHPCSLSCWCAAALTPLHPCVPWTVLTALFLGTLQFLASFFEERLCTALGETQERPQSFSCSTRDTLPSLITKIKISGDIDGTVDVELESDDESATRGPVDLNVDDYRERQRASTQRKFRAQRKKGLEDK